MALSLKLHRLLTSFELMRRALLLCGWFLLPMVVMGQPTLSSSNKKAIALYAEADNYRVRGQFKQAVELLNQALGKDKKFVEAWYRRGMVYKDQREFARATQDFLEGLKLTADVKKQKVFWFELGENYLLEGNYNQSLEYLNRYLKAEVMSRGRIEQAVMWRSNCEFALRNQRSLSDFRPRMLSDTVNAFAMQYFPVLTADEQELIFTRRKGAGNEDDEDLVISRKNASGQWTAPQSISPQINSENNEGTCTVSADGRQIIFTSCRGRSGYGSCDLFLSEKKGDQWSVPVNMGPSINSAAWESQPSLSADGRELYFVSDRKGGLGGRDLYVSYQIDKGKWTKAENLGPVINTRYDEISPFIHVNGRTLFFASNGRPGFGGYDLYRSERDDGKWSVPENFGAPVNTYEDQFSLFITTDGRRGYYSHEKELNDNSGRIYEIGIPQELQIKYRSNYVKGMVRDKSDSQPLRARIELFDIRQNKLVSFVESDSVTGAYLMVLTQGAEYALYVSRPGYLFQNLYFNYVESEHLAPIVMDISLERAKEGAAVVLNNIFFDYNKFDLKEKSYSQLDEVVRFMQENPALRVEISGHTDNQGSADYNRQLSLKRAQAVASYLATKGVQPQRVLQKGYGADKPITDNDTEEGRQQNRRIEFRVLGK